MPIKVVEAGTGVGVFKGGLYGKAGGGKSWTATEFMRGIKQHFKLPGRIWFFDTEGGAEFVNKQIVQKRLGENMMVVKSRALGDVLEFIDEAEKANACGWIVDSVTHIWDEVQKSFLKQLNEKRRANRQGEFTKIEWQHRGQLNDIWEKFTTRYINSPLHAIIAGRSANIWEMTVNDEGKKELNRVGSKMKTQSEMAYEPSFLAEMESENYIENDVQGIRHHITVLKDRFNVLDGKTAIDPTFDFIKPHVDLLTPGAQNVVDTERQTNMNVNDEGNSQWRNEQQQREIAFERFYAEIDAAFVGASAEMKVAKQRVAKLVYGTPSGTEIQNMPSAKIRAGFPQIATAIAAVKDAIEAEKKAEEEKQAAEKAAKKGATK